jgi:hypothetical protein
MEHRWNEIERGNPCPSATLSTTNPIWTDPGSSLSHGTAKLTTYSINSRGYECVGAYLNLSHACVACSLIKYRESFTFTL